MLEQFNFKPQPDAHSETEKLIFVAANGQGYVANNELHLCGSYHYVYKFAGEPAGWYMRNPSDNIDRYLGEGASPSLQIVDIDVKDAEYFESIKYVQSDEARIEE